MFYKRLILVLMLFTLSMPVVADDRNQAELPGHVSKHLMSTMRDHLNVLEEITFLLSEYKFEQAADLAEKRLGMSTVEIHYKRHVGKYMPKAMQKLGTGMHKAATHFAKITRNADKNKELNKALAALSGVIKQCTACHSSYKVHN